MTETKWGNRYRVASTPEQTVNYTAIATQAFIYGYALLIFYISEQQLTNVPAPIYVSAKGQAATPINQFANFLSVPTSNFFGCPNADTLYFRRVGSFKGTDSV